MADFDMVSVVFLGIFVGTLLVWLGYYIGRMRTPCSDVMSLVAIPFEHLVPTNFILGPKKVKSWSFTDMVTGERITGDQAWADVFYDVNENPLLFTIEKVKSNTNNLGPGSMMSLSLQKEIAKKVRVAVDTPLFNLAYFYRAVYWGSRGAKIKDPSEMRTLFHGAVSDDSLVANMKRKKQQLEVNFDMCSIQDADGKSFSVDALDGKMLKKVVVHVEKIEFSDKIRVHCNYRLIVVDERSRPFWKIWCFWENKLKTKI